MTHAKVAPRSPYLVGEWRTRSHDPVLADHLRVPPAAELGRALLRSERHVDDPKPLLVSLGPLEVIEQRPEEIPADVVALAHGPMHLE